MIPAFDDSGYLPAGIHRCPPEALVERFGFGSPEREVETQELLDFFRWAARAGIIRIIINGSYVTAKLAPNDVDVVVLPGPNYPGDELPWSECEARWPFLQVFVAADETDLEEWAHVDFGTDRNRQTKGVIEVLV